MLNLIKSTSRTTNDQICLLKQTDEKFWHYVRFRITISRIFKLLSQLIVCVICMYWKQISWGMFFIEWNCCSSVQFEKFNLCKSMEAFYCSLKHSHQTRHYCAMRAEKSKDFTSDWWFEITKRRVLKATTYAESF